MKSPSRITTRKGTALFTYMNINQKKYLLLAFLFILVTMHCAGSSERVQTLNTGVEQMCEQITITLRRGNNKTLAIMDFSDFKGGKNDFGRYLSEKLIYSMYKIEGIKVVERNQLQKILKSLEFQQTGLVDADTLQRIGHLTGANAVLVGTVTDLGDSIEINGRIVNTEDGMIVAVMSVPLAKNKQLDSFFGKTGKDVTANTVKETGWKYAQDIKLTYRINRFGDVECATYNGKDCLWGLNEEQIIKNRIVPLACGEQHSKIWRDGGGYDNPDHWCYRLRLREQNH